MKISYNIKQSTSSGKNSSQTVETKDKTNGKKPYLEQNISNHKLSRSNQKANTKTSPEIKIFHNVEQDTSLEFPLYSNKRKFEENMIILQTKDLEMIKTTHHKHSKAISSKEKLIMK